MKATGSPSTSTHTSPSFFNTQNMKTTYLKVENTIFAVPRHVLNHPGSPFETMFTLPRPKDSGGKEPASEEDPILRALQQATSKLSSMLRILYPGIWVLQSSLLITTNTGSLQQKAVEQTESIVKLKTPLQMIDLGRTYGISDWVKNGYIALCSQEDLDPEELAGPQLGGLALDWKTIGTLLYIWGSSQCRTETETETECQLPFGRYQPYYPIMGGLEPEPSPEEKERSRRTQAITDLVHQRFKQELDELRAFSNVCTTRP
ncbi:hypothetical protein CPC08DRAFT_728350 [Agrocybe pediades]|nr:hypothetical protein CPC08DRAFT_728350 [Agrocybe pediades]